MSVASSSSFSRWHAAHRLDSLLRDSLSRILHTGKPSAHVAGFPMSAGAGTNSLQSGQENPTGASLDLHELTIYDEMQL